MKQTVFDYFYGQEAESFSFYRIPKVLFTDERFAGLTCEAKVLYGLMLDRMSLSVRNGWLGIDEVTKEKYGRNLDANVKDLVERLKRKAYKPQPAMRIYIPKDNGKMRPLAIACYEDKIVQMALKKILEAIYEPRFLENMYGFRPGKGCHDAIKVVYRKLNNDRICYVVDADIKGFFDHMNHEWMVKFLELYIRDPNIIWLVKKFLKAGVMDEGELLATDEGSAQGSLCRYPHKEPYAELVVMPS